MLILKMIFGGRLIGYRAFRYPARIGSWKRNASGACTFPLMLHSNGYVTRIASSRRWSRLPVPLPQHHAKSLRNDHTRDDLYTAYTDIELRSSSLVVEGIEDSRSSYIRRHDALRKPGDVISKAYSLLPGLEFPRARRPRS